MIKGLVITGPTGAIGMALINNCINNKIPVLAICHRGSKRISRIPKMNNVKVIEANLDEYSNIEANITDSLEYDTFIHLAWNGTFGDSRNNTVLQADNIRYSLDAVELAYRLGCRTFVGAGSQAEYGLVSEPLTAMTPVFPQNGYGIAKLAAGNMTRIKSHQHGMRHIWTRILSVYGPYDGDYTMVMSALNNMLAGEDTHFTAGRQIWNYLYSEDAAAIMIELSEKGQDGHIYCLGSEEARPIKEYIGIMYELTGRQGRLGLGDVPYSNEQVMNLCIEKSPIEGFEFTPFEKGIQNTIEWLKETKLKSTLI